MNAWAVRLGDTDEAAWSTYDVVVRTLVKGMFVRDAVWTDWIPVEIPASRLESSAVSRSDGTAGRRIPLVEDFEPRFDVSKGEVVHSYKSVA